MNFDGVVYMEQLENGLTPTQWKKIISFYEDTKEELIPFEAGENNTIMYGLIKNDCYDEKEQIEKELELICEDWSLEPEDGVLRLEINERNIIIKILCDLESIIIE